MQKTATAVVDSPAHRERARTLRLQVCIATVSATLLALQVAFTRILSVVVNFHMVFLVLSAAMLGVGLPGAWLLWRPPGSRTVVRALLVAAFSIPAAVVVLLHFGTPDLDRTLHLAIACLMVPFLSLGAAAAALLIEAEGESFRRVYAVDLLGGAAGALGIIALLDWVPTPFLVVALAWPPLLVVLWLGGRRDSLSGTVIAVSVLALLAWGEPLHVRYTKNYDESSVRAHVIGERWSSTTRLAVFDRPFFMGSNSFFTWGPGRNAPPDLHAARWIEQDGGAGTPVMKYDGHPEKLESLDYDVTSFGYQLRPPKSVLVVGPGGGRDVLTALRNRAAHVRGVEVNRGMIELMQGPLADFSGHVYSDPRVDIELAEARSYLARSDEQYDLLQISLIDSFAATAAGAHALSEGYLYTVEAVRTYLRKLRPGGILSISRWSGFEASRLLGTVSAAVEAEGWSRPGEHILAQRAVKVVTIIASPTPFSAEERARAVELSRTMGWDVTYPVSGSSEDACVESRGTRCSKSPAVDDAPFFFVKEHALTATIWDGRGLGRIREVAFFAVLGLILSIFGPLFPERASISGPVVVSGLYYALIGVGFMLVEVGLTHRFVEYVGHPTTSASVVLTGLLLGTGAGSYLLPTSARRAWRILTSVVIVAVAFAAPWVFMHTRALGPAQRGLIAGLLSAGVAFQLGAWFPAGLVRWGDRRKAWFWLVNGTASVVGGMVALGIAIDFGFRALFLGAATVYLFAAGLLLVAPRERTLPAR